MLVRAIIVHWRRIRFVWSVKSAAVVLVRSVFTVRVTATNRLLILTVYFFDAARDTTLCSFVNATNMHPTCNIAEQQ